MSAEKWADLNADVMYLIREAGRITRELAGAPASPDDDPDSAYAAGDQAFAGLKRLALIAAIASYEDAERGPDEDWAGAKVVRDRGGNLWARTSDAGWTLLDGQGDEFRSTDGLRDNWGPFTVVADKDGGAR